MIIHKSYGIVRSALHKCVIEDSAQIKLAPFLASSMEVVMQRHIKKRGLMIMSAEYNSNLQYSQDPPETGYKVRSDGYYRITRQSVVLMG
jgi:hypothetical protein